ncbi:MAG TPA: hypothetical protein VF085_02885 [Solirubrobacterales bacterium]
MTGNDSKARAGRHRRLHGKAKRAEELSKKLTHRLAAPEPDVADLKNLVRDLRPVLASLRKSTLAQNGPHAAIVASGIADLATAFERLAQSKQNSSPKSALQQLIEGKRALDSAAAKAQKAGDAWPL